MAPFFYNKLVWITGASSGIGEHLAYLLSSLGARLVISGRNLQALQRIKTNCTNAESVQIISFDMEDPEAVQAAAQEVLRLTEGIDIMIHNAAVAARGRAEETTDDIYRKVMETNFFGPVALTRALLPSMLKRKGQFAVISSLSGQFGVPGLSGYSASKHALHGYFESLRAEVHAKGIRISMIIPGFVNTPILQNGISIKGKTSKNLSVNEKGMDPAICAEKILRAIAAEKAVALVGGKEMAAVYLNRLLPQLFRHIIRNHPVRWLTRVRNFFKSWSLSPAKSTQQTCTG